MSNEIISDVCFSNGNNVNVCINRNTSVYQLIESVNSDAILVISHITEKEFERIDCFSREYKWHVYTEKPVSIREYDIQEQLSESCALFHCDKIRMNYLHFGDHLYAFSNITDESEITDIIDIFPIGREDAVLTHGKLSGNISTVVSAVIERVSEQIENSPADTQNESEAIKGKEIKEQIDILTHEISSRFNKLYTGVRVTFHSGALENKTISLTSLYKKLNIEQGRLKGSWQVFSDEQVFLNIDKGIVKKAVDLCNKRHVLEICKYGHVIRKENLDAYTEELSKIKENYKGYISGNENIKSVGEVLVSKPCSLKECINDSQKSLKEYLLKSCKDTLNSSCTPDYAFQYIDQFVCENFSGFFPFENFAGNIDIQITYYNFSELQWRNKDFVQSVIDCFENHYVENEWLRLIYRLMDCLMIQSKNGGLYAER